MARKDRVNPASAGRDSSRRAFWRRLRSVSEVARGHRWVRACVEALRSCVGSVRNGSSLLGLPQFPSSNVELGAVSVRNRSAAPGGTGRWPAPRPAFLSREAGEASEGPGATRHVGSRAPSRRVLGRRWSHDIPSARRGSVSRVRGAGGAGKDARRRLPGAAQAGGRGRIRARRPDSPHFPGTCASGWPAGGRSCRQLTEPPSCR